MANLPPSRSPAPSAPASSDGINGLSMHVLESGFAHRAVPAAPAARLSNSPSPGAGDAGSRARRYSRDRCRTARLWAAPPDGTPTTTANLPRSGYTNLVRDALGLCRRSAIEAVDVR